MDSEHLLIFWPYLSHPKSICGVLYGNGNLRDRATTFMKTPNTNSRGKFAAVNFLFASRKLSSLVAKSLFAGRRVFAFFHTFSGKKFTVPNILVAYGEFCNFPDQKIDLLSVLSNLFYPKLIFYPQNILKSPSTINKSLQDSRKCGKYLEKKKRS